jgi:putative membrane protein
VEWAAIVMLAAVATAYGTGAGRLRRASRGSVPPGGRVGAFVTGLTALAVALSPWLDALAERNLAAHMAQHVILVLVAAPLVVLGSPLLPLSWALGSRRQLTHAVPPRLWRVRVWVGSAPGLVTTWILATAALWGWHLPAAYEAAVSSDAVHVVEHVTFVGTAILFCSGLAAARATAGYGAALICLLLAAGQSAALGALLTFSSVPWYPSYPSLQDQQLAGLLMWVPGSLVYLTAAAVLFGRWLDREEAVAQRSV